MELIKFSLIFVDTNECQNSTACGENTICENTPGSYICNCKPGFIKKPADPRYNRKLPN